MKSLCTDIQVLPTVDGNNDSDNYIDENGDFEFLIY
jgi:hypothetical protein